MKLRICKSFQFSSAHYLGNDNLTKKEQEEFFGKCSGMREGTEQRYPHGHTYDLDITVEGEANEFTGMMINFTELKKIVNKCILDEYDHKCLNWEVIPYSTNVIPTAENMVLEIYKTLLPEIEKQGLTLYSVKLWEGPGSCAELIKD